MIYWAPLLHFYQPPTQTYQILEKVCNESYRPLVKLITEEPLARVTVNINGVLTEMLQQHGMGDVVSGLQVLAEIGKIEFTGSAKYHPILSLIPQNEIVRQIELNYETNSHYFGESYRPRGFFSPEMCYSRNIVAPILKTGHDWLILSGIACPVPWATRVIYEISGGTENLTVFFRDDILSNQISFQNINAAGFVDFMRHLDEKNVDIYVITAMDAETFGHHIKKWEELFLRSVFKTIEQRIEALNSNVTLKEIKAPEIRPVTISQLLGLFPKGSLIEPRPSSWSTSIADIDRGNPYPLWNSKDTPLHDLQWRYLRLAIELTEKAVSVAKSEPAREYAGTARRLLDEAEHSCQFWWASKKPIRNLSLIYRGLSEQSETILNAYRAIQMSDISEKELKECYRLFVAATDLRNQITNALITS